MRTEAELIAIHDEIARFIEESHRVMRANPELSEAALFGIQTAEIALIPIAWMLGNPDPRADRFSMLVKGFARSKK